MGRLSRGSSTVNGSLTVELFSLGLMRNHSTESMDDTVQLLLIPVFFFTFDFPTALTTALKKCDSRIITTRTLEASA